MVTQNNTCSWRVYLTGVISGIFFFALCGAVLAQQNRGAIVQTSPVEKMTSPNFSVIGGYVVAGNPIAITASLSAKIELNNLRIGDLVKAGDVIAKQDAFEIIHQLRIHRSELEATRNEIASLTANLEYEESLLLLVQEQLALLKQRAEFAQKLAQSNAISIENAENAEIALNAVRQQLVSRNKTLSELNFSIKLLSGTEEQLMLQIDKLEQDISDATLKSPVDGQIISLFSDQSGFARQGDMIASIRTEMGYEVEIDLPVKYLPFMKSAKQVRARSQTGDSFMLSLRVILPEENRRTASRLTRLSFKEDVVDSVRSNGAQIDVLVPSSKQQELLVIPQDAVVPVTGGHVVFVFDRGIAKRQTVRLGSALGERIIVTAGLQAGELVITRGNEGLDDGAAVKQGKIPKREVPNAQGSSEQANTSQPIPTELADDAKTWLLKWQTSRGEQSAELELSSKASLYNKAPVLVIRKDGLVYLDTELVLPFGIVTLSFALAPGDDTLNGTVILSGLPNGREVEMDVTGTAK